METLFALLRVISQILGALTLASAGLAGVTAFAYWLFKRYAAGWLENRFKKELADYTYKQNREIEQLRGQIATLLDRSTKLNHHEFEVLPRAWDLLTEALGSASALTAAYREGVDPGAMTADDLEVLLRESPLEEHHKRDVRDAGRFEKATIYSAFMERHEFNTAQRHCDAFQNYTIQYGLFIDPMIRPKLAEASQELRRAVRAWKLKIQHPDILPYPVSEAQAHVATASALSKEIDAMMTARLWGQTQVTSPAETPVGMDR